MAHFTTPESGLNTTLAVVTATASFPPASVAFSDFEALFTAALAEIVGNVTAMPEIGADPNQANVAVFNEEIAPQVKAQRTRGATSFTVAMTPGNAGQAVVATALSDGAVRTFRLRIATNKADADSLDAADIAATDRHEDFYFSAQITSYSPGATVDGEATATIGMAVKSTVYGPLTKT